MTLKRLIQSILLIWFLAVNVAILVPSYRLLFGPSDPTNTALQAPEPPQPPTLVNEINSVGTRADAGERAEQLERYKQQVTAYAEQIKGYTQQVAAYKTYGDAQEKSSVRVVYELVVKGSLVTLLSGFATALVALVFANLGAGLMDNMIRVRSGHDPEKLKLL